TGRPESPGANDLYSRSWASTSRPPRVLKPNRYCGLVTHTVSAADGRTVGMTDGGVGTAVGPGALGRAAATVSGRPTVRPTDRFFGGNRMLGSTATMSISTMARMTRRSTVGILGHRVVAARVQRRSEERRVGKAGR